MYKKINNKDIIFVLFLVVLSLIPVLSLINPGLPSEIPVTEAVFTVYYPDGKPAMVMAER